MASCCSKGARATLLAAAAAALAFAVQARAEWPSRDTFVALSSSVVRVEASSAAGRLSVGTGVTVAPSVIVTNCHVIRDATVVRVSGLGRLWDVTEQVADTLHDLCFLRVPSWRGRPVVLGAADRLRPGQTTAALGFTGGTAVSLRLGHVVALHTFGEGHVIESDAPFTSGASGGGLFDTTGALVGLLTFRSRGSASSYYALPVEWVRDRLPYESQWSELRPLDGARPFWQGDTEALPYFMRVALLESDGNWVALLDLANRWSADSPMEAEPLVVRGRALEHLQRPQAAAGAFRDALKLAPDDPGALYGLAIASAEIGDERALRDAQARLGTVHEGLAASLERQLARKRSTE